MNIIPRFTLEVGEEKRIRFLMPLEDALSQIVKEPTTDKQTEVFGILLWSYQRNTVGKDDRPANGEFQLFIVSAERRWPEFELLDNILHTYTDHGSSYYDRDYIVGRHLAAPTPWSTHQVQKCTVTPIVLQPWEEQPSIRLPLPTGEQIQYSFSYHLDHIHEWHTLLTWQQDPRNRG